MSEISVLFLVLAVVSFIGALRARYKQNFLDNPQRILPDPVLQQWIEHNFWQVNEECRKRKKERRCYQNL